MTDPRKSIWLVVGMVCALGYVSASIAQDTADSDAAARAAASTNKSFIQVIKDGGVLMWPLGFLSVATVALSVYGFIIVRESKMLTPELVPLIQEALDGLDIERAKSVCDGTPSLLTNVVNAGLQRISDGYLDVQSMESAMEEAAVEEAADGLRTINYLSVIAQIAPMVGLLGTVSGMIKAFAKIGQGAMGKPEVLAGDISEALVTTATGLIIGIPAMFIYFYLKGRYTGNTTRLGRIVGNLAHHLVAATRRGAAEEPAAAEEA